jgi:hypothetical protein
MATINGLNLQTNKTIEKKHKDLKSVLFLHFKSAFKKI